MRAGRRPDHRKHSAHALSFLVEHAGLDPSVARKMRREDITLTVLQEATLAERREILRSMGIKYGPILAINRALEKRQRMIKEGELDDAADDEDAAADDDDVPPEATGRCARRARRHPSSRPRCRPACRRRRCCCAARAPTLRGLQLILGNALDNPDQVAFRTIQLANPLFQERVWSAPGGASLLRAAGFAEGAKRTLPPRRRRAARRARGRKGARRRADRRARRRRPRRAEPDGPGAARRVGRGPRRRRRRRAAARRRPIRRGARAEIRQAIDLARLQINSRMGHLHSWDNALAMGTLAVDVETLSADEVRSCRACNPGRLARRSAGSSRGSTP